MLLTTVYIISSVFSLYLLGFFLFINHNSKLFKIIQDDLEWLLVDFLLTDKDNPDNFKTMMARHEMILDHLSDRIILLYSKTSDFKFKLGCLLYNLFLKLIKLKMTLTILINIIDDFGLDKLSTINDSKPEHLLELSSITLNFMNSIKQKRKQSINYMN